MDHCNKPEVDDLWYMNGDGIPHKRDTKYFYLIMSATMCNPARAFAKGLWQLKARRVHFNGLRQKREARTLPYSTDK